MAKISIETVQMCSRLEQNLILVKVHSTLFPAECISLSGRGKGRPKDLMELITLSTSNEEFNRSDRTYLI